MTQVPRPMRTEFIPGDCRYVRLLENFPAYSEVLGRWIEAPAGFVFDLESIPLLRSDNPEAGCFHDYLSRLDSDPVVSSMVAALVYYEIQDFFDRQEKGGLMHKSLNCIWRYTKVFIVVTATRTYFHKHKVLDSYEVIKHVQT